MINTRDARQMANELARLLWALLPYILIGVAASILIRPDVWPLAGFPILAGIIVGKLPRPLRLAGFVAINVGLMLLAQVVYGDLAALVILAAAAVRATAAIK